MCKQQIHEENMIIYSFPLLLRFVPSLFYCWWMDRWIESNEMHQCTLRFMLLQLRKKNRNNEEKDIFCVGLKLLVAIHSQMSFYFTIFTYSNAVSATFDWNRLFRFFSFKFWFSFFFLSYISSIQFFFLFWSRCFHLYLFHLFSFARQGFSHQILQKKKPLLLCKQATVLCFIIHLISLYHFFFECSSFIIPLLLLCHYISA